MTYATVMVSLALGRSNDARLEIAGQLAKRFDACVIGITAGELSPPLYFTTGEQAQKALDEGQAAVRNRVAEVEAVFRAAMQNRAAAIEWRCAEDFPTRFCPAGTRCRHCCRRRGRSRCARRSIHADQSKRSRDANGKATACCSRQLQLARSPEHPDRLERHTPEARRAIADALLMLRQAKDINVVEIIEDDVNRPAALSGVNDIVAWLSRHGLVASGQVPGECGDAARQLERIASQVGAGLVVAGAHGHSRLREWILGGVTKRLINPSNYCSLLSR